MKDEQLLRYSRQIMLPEMDVAGQQKLIDATVLIVGTVSYTHLRAHET